MKHLTALATAILTMTMSAGSLMAQVPPRPGNNLPTGNVFISYGIALALFALVATAALKNAKRSHLD